MEALGLGPARIPSHTFPSSCNDEVNIELYFTLTSGQGNLENIQCVTLIQYPKYKKRLQNLYVIRKAYRVSHLVADVGWVELDLGCFTTLSGQKVATVVAHQPGELPRS